MADTGYGFERNGEWRNQVARPLQPINPARGGNRNCTAANRVRDDLMTYVNTVGKVPWQNDFI
jgi:hypothetical protein